VFNSDRLRDVTRLSIEHPLSILGERFEIRLARRGIHAVDPEERPRTMLIGSRVFLLVDLVLS